MPFSISDFWKVIKIFLTIEELWSFLLTIYRKRILSVAVPRQWKMAFVDINECARQNKNIPNDSTLL